MMYSDLFVITIRVPGWEHVMLIATTDEVLRKEGVLSNGLREHTWCDEDELIKYLTEYTVELPLYVKWSTFSTWVKDIKWQFGGASSQFRSSTECRPHAVTWWPFKLASYFLVHLDHYPLENILNHQKGANSAPGPQLLVQLDRPWLTPRVAALINCHQNWNEWRWHGEIGIMFCIVSR